MSDSGFSDVQGVPAESLSTEEMTAGAMIRVAREAAGLHVAALAVSMKIPVKKLEALEADRLDLLHDAVFVRALAASVCRALKMDPAPVLSKLPLNKVPQLNGDERGINAPFQSQGGSGGISLKVMLTNPYALLFVALIVAGMVVMFVPGIRLPDWSRDDTAQAPKPTDANETPVVEHAPPEVVNAGADSNSATRSNEPVATPTPVMIPSPELPAPKASAVVQAPVVVVAKEPVVVASKPQSTASRPSTSPSAPVLAASRPASAPSLPSTGMLVFKAKGPTWVKVTDAKGIVQLGKMLAGGDVIGVNGTPPLAVVIGKVDVTEVEVRGKAFPLTATSKDNVARFEVK